MTTEISLVCIKTEKLRKVISHLRNAIDAPHGGAYGVTEAAIKISDNILCNELFGEVLYPEYSLD